MKAIPTMISLNEKYENQGLVVIGIDPEDNNIKNEEFVSWIKKKEIKYKVARVERNGEIIKQLQC
jgi:thiol-disulfide isomerase/thioredoxin